MRANENSFAPAFGGDGGTCECRGVAPPDPPSVGDATGLPPFFVLKKFLANERDNIFGEGVKNYKKPHQTNGGLSSTCKHVRA
jgi:hypothetical protein